YQTLSIVKTLYHAINLLAHAGKMPATPDQLEAFRNFNEYGQFANVKMYMAYKQAYKCEVRRLYGDSTFDQIINFEDYSENLNGLSDTVISSSSANQI